MPCRDSEPTDFEQVLKFQKRVDELAQMLCGLCREIEDLNPDDQKGMTIFKEVPRLVEWWEAHKKADAERKAMEKQQREIELIRSRALNKLTTQELKVLGLEPPAQNKKKGKKRPKVRSRKG